MFLYRVMQTKIYVYTYNNYVYITLYIRITELTIFYGLPWVLHFIPLVVYNTKNIIPLSFEVRGILYNTYRCLQIIVQYFPYSYCNIDKRTTSKRTRGKNKTKKFTYGQISTIISKEDYF